MDVTATQQPTVTKRGSWSALELQRDLAGPRHYLDGRGVHFGAGHELQSTAQRSDDYGEFTGRST